MELADFILRVRFDYNDIDGDRVEDALIVDYFKEGVAELFQINPRKFLKTVVAKLDDSDLQQPCCCDLLFSVDAITDAHGNFVSELKAVDGTAQTAFGKKNCVGRKSDIRSYSKVPNTDNQFTVNPPVSPNENLYARLTCAVFPDLSKLENNAQFDSTLVDNYAPLLDYVLYRLFGSETESASSQDKSAYHYKRFLDGVLLKEQVKQAVISGGVSSVKRGGK